MSMKSIFLVLLLVVLGAVVSGALEPGDSAADVKRELGEPSGFIDASGSQVYIYDRGRVRVEDGVVVSADLISQEALDARREAEALERELQAEEMRRKRAERYEEGTRVLAQKLDDPAFMNSSAENRVSYWKSFQVKYPEVTLPADYEVALREREAELRTVRAEQRIRDLEDEARRAEVEAARAAEEASNRSSTTVSSGYYGSPVVIYGGSSRCSCRHNSHRRCPVHYPTTYNKPIYTPYESTPGYGYQRPLTSGSSGSTISSRPWTGGSHPVPQTRPQTRPQPKPNVRPKTRP